LHIGTIAACIFEKLVKTFKSHEKDRKNYVRQLLQVDLVNSFFTFIFFRWISENAARFILLLFVNPFLTLLLILKRVIKRKTHEKKTSQELALFFDLMQKERLKKRQVEGKVPNTCCYPFVQFQFKQTLCKLCMTNVFVHVKLIKKRV
jgi:dolichol kinase